MMKTNMGGIAFLKIIRDSASTWACPIYNSSGISIRIRVFFAVQTGRRVCGAGVRAMTPALFPREVLQAHSLISSHLRIKTPAHRESRTG